MRGLALQCPPAFCGSCAGELVIIDVNFFPSFKGIPEAPHALRAALLARHREHLGKLEHAV
jgi:hypothetical protein